jgi:hypothetical protein
MKAIERAKIERLGGEFQPKAPRNLLELVNLLFLFFLLRLAICQLCGPVGNDEVGCQLVRMAFGSLLKKSFRLNPPVPMIRDFASGKRFLNCCIPLG